MKSSDWVHEGDLGSYLLDEEGRVWKMVSYVDKPQATFQLVDSGVDSNSQIGKQVTHVVGCLNYQEMGLRKLAPVVKG